MLEAAERESGRASQQALLPSFQLGICLCSRPGSRPSPFRLTASSPQLAAAPCWNPDFLCLENKASQKAVSSQILEERIQTRLPLSGTYFLEMTAPPDLETVLLS